MAEPSLLVERHPPLVTIRLNRPARRNALSLELMTELRGLFGRLSEEKDVAVIILAGEGPAFSSGHDLTEMLGRDLDTYREIFGVCTDLMTLIQRIPQPVIAQIDGIATAAGCQLVAACDLAVASEQSRFATPGVRIGLFCTTPMVALTRVIGRKRAIEMLLTGRAIDARTASEWGLINRAVPREQLTQTVLELANEIARSSAATIALGKQAFYTQIDLDQTRAYGYANEVMSMNAAAGDAQEGMSAFLEKRAPRWPGK